MMELIQSLNVYKKKIILTKKKIKSKIMEKRAALRFPFLIH